MSPPTLSTLPPELTCRIFELTDSLQATFALSLTSKHFQRIWYDYSHSIYLALYPEASQLAIIQKSLRGDSIDDNHPKSSLDLLPSQRKPCIVDDVRLNAITVAKAGRAFVKIMRDENPFYFRHNQLRVAGFLSPVERDRFTHAYYHYWIKNVEEQIIMGQRWHVELDLRALFLVPTLLKPSDTNAQRRPISTTFRLGRVRCEHPA